MADYDRHPRVQHGPGDTYTLTHDGQQYMVHRTALGWTVFVGAGHNPPMAHDDTGRPAAGFPTAEAAIDAVLRAPRNAR